jgi:hypothetical protein
MELNSSPDFSKGGSVHANDVDLPASQSSGTRNYSAQIGENYSIGGLINRFLKNP